MGSGSSRKLKRSFYDRPTLDVCRDILGMHIVFRAKGHLKSARIVEVEAYIGEDDPACHASVGRTPRNQIMYGAPGHTYIYFIYGMYHCLNFVTEATGFPAAILLRAAEPIRGFEAALDRHGRSSMKQLSGPGKFCTGFGLTREHNGLDLAGSTLYLADHGTGVSDIVTTPRVGIRNGCDRLWRFYDAQSPSVSAVRTTVNSK